MPVKGASACITEPGNCAFERYFVEVVAYNATLGQEEWVPAEGCSLRRDPAGGTRETETGCNATGLPTNRTNGLAFRVQEVCAAHEPDLGSRI